MWNMAMAERPRHVLPPEGNVGNLFQYPDGGGRKKSRSHI